MKTNSSPKHSSAFSLLELLMVMTIMAIVARFLIPAVAQLVRGTPLTQAAQVVSAEFLLGRQYAVTKNRPVEVRMIKFGDPEVPGEVATDSTTGKYRAIQLMEVLDSGAMIAIDKPHVFLNPVIMSAGTLSSLLDPAITSQKALKASETNNGLPATSNPLLPRGVERNYEYVAFRFMPNGSTNLTPTTKWYLTLQNSMDVVTGGVLPSNYFLMQVDPVNGGLKNFRPGI